MNVIRDIYDPSATLKHYSRMAREFAMAAEQIVMAAGARQAAMMEAGMPEPDFEAHMSDAVFVEGMARSDVYEKLAAMAQLMAQGYSAGDVAIYSQDAIGPHVVRREAPEYLEDRPAPQIVVTRTAAADNYMECRAYEEFRKLVTLFDKASAGRQGVFAGGAQADALDGMGRDFYKYARDTLETVGKKLDRDIDWLMHHDPKTRPLTAADYSPV